MILSNTPPDLDGLFAAHPNRVPAAAPEAAGGKVPGERVRGQLFMTAAFFMFQGDMGIMQD